MDNVRACIARLGQTYRDGSSAAPGTLYQPLGDWLPALADVPVHKPRAVREDFQTVTHNYGDWTWRMVLEIGCANGYYGLGLQQRGIASLHGVERDPDARGLCHALGFRDVVGHLAELPHNGSWDVGLCLNVQMWAHKQGDDRRLMDFLAAHCATVYFQTAGQRSQGMYTVPEFRDIDDERAYLRDWFTDVTWIRDTPHHGGLRTLWRCAR